MSPMRFPDFDSVEAYLNSLVNYESTTPLGGDRDRPKLQPTLDAATRLGLCLSLLNCIHIAGTKGKGSVVSFLEGLLSPQHPTLSFTSPHLVSVKERIRLNGETLPDSLWTRAFEAITPALDELPPVRLSYFETTFIAYLWLSQELRTGIHIVECGLGGKWDATNVLVNTLPVITRIDYDHTQILGNTLTEIARDKAGIIKSDTTVICGAQPAEAERALSAAILDQSATATYLSRDFSAKREDDRGFVYRQGKDECRALRLSVTGEHQLENAAVAIRAAREYFPAMTCEEIRKRLASVKIPGRQQWFSGSPNVLLDVAHNAVSFRALADTLKQLGPEPNCCALIGLMKDKDARACLTPLREIVSRIIAVRLPSPRSRSEMELCNLAGDLGFASIAIADLDQAFDQVHRTEHADTVVIAGSFYLAGEYLKWRNRAGIA